MYHHFGVSWCHKHRAWRQIMAHYDDNDVDGDYVDGDYDDDDDDDDDDEGE